MENQNQTETENNNNDNNNNNINNKNDNNIPLQLGDESSFNNCSNNIKKIYSTISLENNKLENLGSGDTTLYTSFLNNEESNYIFNELFQQKEFTFQQWYRMPSNLNEINNNNYELHPLRRVKVAMANPTDDGLIPYFRFPVNNQSRHGIITPMTPIVESIRIKVSNFLGCDFNHAVVLLYRDGDDCIGYHKDKPLDLDENAPIASVSLGYPRTYSLRDYVHNPKQQQMFEIPSGSLLSLGPITNQTMYHSILPNINSDETSTLATKTSDIENDENNNKNNNENNNSLKSNETNNELNSSPSNTSCARISLTFRKVSTFLNPLTNELIGKGAEYQSLDWPIELKGLHRLD